MRQSGRNFVGVRPDWTLQHIHPRAMVYSAEYHARCTFFAERADATGTRRRRRDWDPAFSIKALAGYKSNIQRNAETLLDQVARLSRDGLVDIRECMMWFGFDVMGELGFGRSFGTLEAAKTSAVVHLVELGVRSSKQPQQSILPMFLSRLLAKTSRIISIADRSWQQSTQ